MANKINVDRGTTYVMTINYQKNGVAADLTGATVRFTVKTPAYDTDNLDTSAVIKKDINSFTNPTSGVATITLVPTDTQSLLPANYNYDLKVEEASGIIHTLDKGLFVLNATATNRFV